MVYTYAREGTGDHPAQILADFQGTLAADGGSAFNKAASKSGVVRAGCWAHARRKFWEARDTNPRLVHHALETIREIFQLERAYREPSPTDRARRRRATTWPIIDAFRAWCQALSTSEPPKSPLASHGRQLRPAPVGQLVVFIDDGAIPAHNNLSELLLRQPVVGRKKMKRRKARWNRPSVERAPCSRRAFAKLNRTDSRWAVAVRLASFSD